MPLLSALLPIVAPLLLRALAAIGMSVITFTGVDTVLSNLIDLARAEMSGLTPNLLAFASIAGIPKAFGIIAGAMTTRVGLWVASSATRWVVKG